MRKIMVFLMLICLVGVFSGCEGDQGITGAPGKDAEIQEFTGTLGKSLWDNEMGWWALGFDTGGDNKFVLNVEIGATINGINVWMEPKKWFYFLDKENNELVIIIFPSAEYPVVKNGTDYRITCIY